MFGFRGGLRDDDRKRFFYFPWHFSLRFLEIFLFLISTLRFGPHILPNLPTLRRREIHQLLLILLTLHLNKQKQFFLLLLPSFLSFLNHSQYLIPFLQFLHLDILNHFNQIFFLFLQIGYILYIFNTIIPVEIFTGHHHQRFVSAELELLETIAGVYFT